MKLPRIALENYQFTLVMFVMLISLGVVSFLTMPRSEDPQVSPVASSIYIVYPGASPEDMETLIVDPLEQALNELDDIDKMDTDISDGLAHIRIEFFSDNDADDKYAEVLRKINRVRSSLPEDLAALEVIKWGVSNVNIVQLALTSESHSYAQMEKQAEILRKRFERIAGIKKAETWAYPEQIVDIAIDFDKLAHLKVPLNQVFGAIQMSNTSIPGGSIDIADKKFNVRTSGFYENLADIRSTVVANHSGQLIRLGDVADVHMDYAEEVYYARLNGLPAVFVTAKQKEGTNIFSIMDELHTTVDVFATELPEGMGLSYVFDQSESVANRLSLFFSSLFQGMLLVGFVVFLIFGFRASVVIALAIPIAITIGIGFTDLSGYGLEQMSIVALVIALGLLVDNAIVITENIARFLRMGKNSFAAAVEGTRQVAWAVASSTATTVLAFIPIMMLPGITGDFIRSMPVTVVYTLTASLLVALTLTPFISRKVLLQGEGKAHSGRIHRWIDKQVAGPYHRTLTYALTHKGRVIGLAIFAFFASLALFPLVGVSFFPKAEKPQLMINIRTPQGSSLAFTDSVTSEVERRLLERDDVRHISVNFGRSNPQLYYNVWPRREQSNYGEIFIQMKDLSPAEMELVVAELRAQFDDYMRARIEVKEFAQGPPVEAPVAIKVIGNNLDVLSDLATDVEAIFARTNGAINISNPLATAATDIAININREKAGRLGIAIIDIDRAVRAAITGVEVTTFRDDENEDYPVVVRLPLEGKPGRADFNRIYVTSASGEAIPLAHLAQIEFVSSPPTITHYKMDRNVSITADVESGFTVDAVTNAIIDELEAYPWPEGYRYVVGGELESRQESFGGLGRAVIIAMLAIFGVLVLQFRSFTQPIIVFMAIPPGRHRLDSGAAIYRLFFFLHGVYRPHFTCRYRHQQFDYPRRLCQSVAR
jgi:multidrug efflux pump subunit AcrB